MSSFSSRLILLRNEMGLSQEELAKALHVSKGAIGNYESGARVPRLDALNAIAEFFNVDLDYLAGRNRDKPEFTAEELWIISCYRNIPDEAIKKAFKTMIRQYDPLPVEKDGGLLESLLTEEVG